MPKFNITKPIKLMKGILHLAEEEVKDVEELIARGALELVGGDDEASETSAAEPAADPKAELDKTEPAAKADSAERVPAAKAGTPKAKPASK